MKRTDLFPVVGAAASFVVLSMLAIDGSAVSQHGGEGRCENVTIWECLEDSLTLTYREWEQSDVRKWKRAVEVATWDTTSSRNGCDSIAFFIKATRDEAASAFANFRRRGDNSSENPTETPEYFIWGRMKPDHNGDKPDGAHGVFRNDSTKSLEHLFVVSDQLDEAGQFRIIIHELAHHAYIKSEEWPIASWGA